jgi:hypothetical protein
MERWRLADSGCLGVGLLVRGKIPPTGVTGFTDGIFNHLEGFSRTFLNPMEQLIRSAQAAMKIIIGELCPTLLQSGFGGV